MREPIISSQTRHLLERRNMLGLIPVLKNLPEPCRLGVQHLYGDVDGDLVLSVQSEAFSPSRLGEIEQFLGKY